jgi:hypothetical protein
MQFGDAFSFQTEPDSWSEPLNLVKRKSKPVAVVAPSSVIEKSSSEKEICKADSTEPVIKDSTDISKGSCDDNSSHVLKLDSVSHLKDANDDRPKGMLETLLTRKDPKQFHRTSDSAQNKYSTEKICEGEKVSGVNEKIGCNGRKMTVGEHAGGSPSILNGSDALRPDGLYSMIHSLAACEQKFLTALYMNSLMTAATTTPPSVIPPPVLGFGFPPGPGYFVGYENSALAEACRSSVVASNAPVMNNLLSFADTQHRLWQMVNWQQERLGLSTATDTSNTAVSSTVEPERKRSISAEQTASNIVIPVPPLMTPVPPASGSMSSSRKSRPNPKR